MKWTVERSPKDQPWLDAVRMMDRSDAILRSNEEENQLAYLAKKPFLFYSLQKQLLKSAMMFFPESIYVSGKQ